MLQIRTFKIDDYESFNKFREIHSPRGDNGLRFTTNHIIMTYEDGQTMPKSDVIQSLKFELGKCLEQQLQYDKQIRKGKKMRDSFPHGGEQWKSMNQQYAASIGMLKIEVMDTDVVAEMLKELGEEVKYENRAIPEFDDGEEKKELIPSDIPNEQGRAGGKGKKGKK